jgi:aspartate/glutamate racemase
MTADEVIVKAFKEDKMLGKGYLNAVQEDTEDNEDVEQSVVEEDEKAANEEEETKNYLVNAAKNIRNKGGKK